MQNNFAKNPLCMSFFSFFFLAMDVFLHSLWFTATTTVTMMQELVICNKQYKNVHPARTTFLFLHFCCCSRSNDSENMIRASQQNSNKISIYSTILNEEPERALTHLPARYYRHLCHCHRIDLFNFIKLLPSKQCITMGLLLAENTVNCAASSYTITGTRLREAKKRRERRKK